MEEQLIHKLRIIRLALIADFLGWENYEDGKTYKFPNLYPIYNVGDEGDTGWISEQISKAEFDTDWNWLMPVVDKIMRTKIGDGEIYVEYPFLRTFGMLNEETKNPMVRFNGFQVFEAETLIEATFLAVVDFLEWWSKHEVNYPLAKDQWASQPIRTA